ncbi:Autophagy-related protein 2 [Frankliniella fusca]|uniref:Autophagy-related protein 2 n=1 Tax=Frankliniella fusca TaxID=407009 RepID=A0AAE1HBS9_9NEOP|nr:Autophagy-related protein 2 [Frankliniella fusca]
MTFPPRPLPFKSTQKSVARIRCDIEPQKSVSQNSYTNFTFSCKNSEMATKHWYAFVRDLQTDGTLKLRTDKVWILHTEEDGQVTRRHFDVELYNAQKSNLQFGMVVKSNIHKIIILELDETPKGLSQKIAQRGPLEPLPKEDVTTYVLSTIKKKEEKQAAASQSTKSKPKKRSGESKQGENEEILCKTVSRKNTDVGSSRSANMTMASRVGNGQSNRNQIMKDKENEQGEPAAASTSSNKAGSLIFRKDTDTADMEMAFEDDNGQSDSNQNKRDKENGQGEPAAASTSSKKGDMCHSITENHSGLPSNSFSKAASDTAPQSQFNKKEIFSKDSITGRKLSADMELGSEGDTSNQSDEDENNEQLAPANASKSSNKADMCHSMMQTHSGLIPNFSFGKASNDSPQSQFNKKGIFRNNPFSGCSADIATGSGSGQYSLHQYDKEDYLGASTSSKVHHNLPRFGPHWPNSCLQLEYGQDSHEKSPSDSSHQIYVGEGRTVSRGALLKIEMKFPLFSQRAEQVFELVRGGLENYRLTDSKGYLRFVDTDIEAVKNIVSMMYFPDGFKVTPKAMKEFCQKQPFEVMRRKKKREQQQDEEGSKQAKKSKND